jgi:hypothetical protein
LEVGRIIQQIWWKGCNLNVWAGNEYLLHGYGLSDKVDGRAQLVVKCIVGSPNVPEYGVSFTHGGRTQLAAKSGFDGDVGDCIDDGYHMGGVSGVFSGDRHDPFSEAGAVAGLDKGAMLEEVVTNGGS